MYTFAWRNRNYATTPTFMVVGCGGTGSLVGEGLCRLFHGRDANIYLVDYDRVEESNLHRQNFYPEDLGKVKSEALATRLSRKYGRKLGYYVHPYSADMMGGHSWMRSTVIIGCVDNPSARRAIGDSLKGAPVWIDSGNGEASGQVLVGDTMTPGNLADAFQGSECQRLPAPSLQEPGLLMPVDEPLPVDCGVAVEQGEQSPIINQAMATLVLQVVSKLVEDKLTWMGVYLDLELGYLRPVPIDPEGVSRICDLPTKKLVVGKASYDTRDL